MPRPRKPTKILQMNGAAKRNPGRMQDRENEPQPEAGIGEAPGHLNAKECAVWDELVSVIPAGVMGNTDRIALEHLARLIVESRGDRENWSSAREKDLLTYLTRFGLTPADRSKVSVPKVRDKSPWQDL